MRFVEHEVHPHDPEGLQDRLQHVRSVLATARRVLVLTGAGISVSAGLPTFRGAGGLYEAGIPAFMHADALPDGLEDLWRFWAPLREQARAAEPTPAHRSLAAWQRSRASEGAEVTVVTQNVDDLHERAGSAPVHHLHGDLFTSTCLTTGCPGRVEGDLLRDGSPPPCPLCGGPTRPKMVLFGEPVDLDAEWATRRAVRDCDAFVAIGTSGAVAPASGLVRYARDVGARTVAVNPAADAGAGFDQHVQLGADVALPVILGSD